MSTLDVLISPALLQALIAYTVISLLLEWLGRRLLATVSDVDSSHWLFEHLLIPSARALALVVFILLAYPTLFGLTEAPSLGSLLSAERGRISHLVNLTFALSLLLPLLPIIGRLPALVLPIQGMAAASLLFHWWAASLPSQQIEFWPNGPVLGILIAMAFAGHALAKQLATRIASQLNQTYEKAEMEALIYRSIILLLQAPVILFYSLSLGQQLR